MLVSSCMGHDTNHEARDHDPVIPELVIFVDEHGNNTGKIIKIAANSDKNLTIKMNPNAEKTSDSYNLTLQSTNTEILTASKTSCPVSDQENCTITIHGNHSGNANLVTTIITNVSTTKNISVKNIQVQ